MGEEHKEEWEEGAAGDQLEQYLDLCQRIYERMEREGSWPWKNWPEEERQPDGVVDSTDGNDLVESDENPDDL